MKRLQTALLASTATIALTNECSALRLKANCSKISPTNASRTEPPGLKLGPEGGDSKSNSCDGKHKRTADATNGASAASSRTTKRYRSTTTLRIEDGHEPVRAHGAPPSATVPANHVHGGAALAHARDAWELMMDDVGEELFNIPSLEWTRSLPEIGSPVVPMDGGFDFSLDMTALPPVSALSAPEMRERQWHSQGAVPSGTSEAELAADAETVQALLDLTQQPVEVLALMAASDLDAGSNGSVADSEFTESASGSGDEVDAGGDDLVDQARDLLLLAQLPVHRENRGASLRNRHNVKLVISQNWAASLRGRVRKAEQLLEERGVAVPEKSPELHAAHLRALDILKRNPDELPGLREALLKRYITNAGTKHEAPTAFMDELGEIVDAGDDETDE